MLLIFYLLVWNWFLENMKSSVWSQNFQWSDRLLPPSVISFVTRAAPGCDGNRGAVALILSETVALLGEVTSDQVTWRQGGVEWMPLNLMLTLLLDTIRNLNSKIIATKHPQVCVWIIITTATTATGYYKVWRGYCVTVYDPRTCKYGQYCSS